MLIGQSLEAQPRLAEIERELGRQGLRLFFATRNLERAYTASVRDGARFHNRITVSLTVAIFDAFLLTECMAIPEIIAFSAFLRFALLTPANLLYVWLDWRGLITRWNSFVVTALLIAPTLLATIESFRVTSATALQNYQAVPLLQLVVLTCRVSIPQAFIINFASMLLYGWCVVMAPFVPDAVRGSLILTDVAIGVSTLVFVWRLDCRDRQVFLLARQASHGRDILGNQNRILARLSQVDALTGLGNRRCFDETLQALWMAPGHGLRAVTLVMFDIDYFKQFNDALGHQAGDECLEALARVVTRCLRNERDTLVRYGGEEFAIVLPDTALEDGLLIAERVRRAVLQYGLPHPGGAPPHVVTVSLGVASVETSSQTIGSLIEAADRCLYAAKRGGRNRVESRCEDVSLPGGVG